jgi:hypothetical protein
MLEQLTTEELKAELEARQIAEAKLNSPINETGYSVTGNTYHALVGEKVIALHSGGSILLDLTIKAVGAWEKPSTREDFMQALENNFTKIREALA